MFIVNHYQFPEIFLFAAKYDAVDTAKLLLEKTSSEEERQSIIKYCDQWIDRGGTALHSSSARNHVNFTKFLLSIIDVDNEMLTVCH